MTKNIVIIVCSGIGKRMNSSIPKQFIKIKEKPIICYTIDKFENCSNIDEIIVVVNEEYIEFFKENIIIKYGYKKITKIVKGGKERLNSVYNGINVVDEKDSIILIHDGVRPFIEEKDIVNIIKKTIKYDACVLGVKVKDTIKVCENNIIKNTPNRDNIWIAQTPQAFKYNIIKKAYDIAIKENKLATDDASLVEELGYNVIMIEGDYNNIKITTQEDLNFFK